MHLGTDLYVEGGEDGCEQMCTLHAVFVLWVCLRETWVVFRDDPQYNVMKYLVFGTISVVYYQSYKLLFLNPIAAGLRPSDGFALPRLRSLVARRADGGLCRVAPCGDHARALPCRRPPTRSLR